MFCCIFVVSFHVCFASDLCCFACKPKKKLFNFQAKQFLLQFLLFPKPKTGGAAYTSQVTAETMHNFRRFFKPSEFPGFLQ
jgi:hypothetical protein